MPIGDPHGGNFVYNDEGIPKGIIAVSIPVRNVKQAVEFYCQKLKMKLMSENDTRAVVAVGKQLIILSKSEKTGVDTGLYLKTESPYDLHRRLVEENVIFVMEPKKIDLGLVTSFKDCDNNIIHVVEVRPE